MLPSRSSSHGDSSSWAAAVKVAGSISGETVAPGAASCPADFVGARTLPGVGDGEVNVDDLLALIASWNQCTPGSCPADLTGNGNVDVDDLLALIQAWGPCPAN